MKMHRKMWFILGTTGFFYALFFQTSFVKSAFYLGLFSDGYPAMLVVDDIAGGVGGALVLALIGLVIDGLIYLVKNKGIRSKKTLKNTSQSTLSFLREVVSNKGIDSKRPLIDTSENKTLYLIILILAGLVFFIGMLIFTNSDSIANQKLSYHTCSTPRDAMVCSGTCEKNEGLVMEHEVNEKKNSVLQKVYFKGDLVQANIYEYCKIFDKKNWDCSTEGKSFSIQMNNGKYAFIRDSSSIHDCAK